MRNFWKNAAILEKCSNFGIIRHFWQMRLLKKKKKLIWNLGHFFTSSNIIIIVDVDNNNFRMILKKIFEGLPRFWDTSSHPLFCCSFKWDKFTLKSYSIAYGCWLSYRQCYHFVEWLPNGTVFRIKKINLRFHQHFENLFMETTMRLL